MQIRKISNDEKYAYLLLSTLLWTNVSMLNDDVILIFETFDDLNSLLIAIFQPTKHHTVSIF